MKPEGAHSKMLDPDRKGSVHCDSGRSPSAFRQRISRQTVGIIGPQCLMLIGLLGLSTHPHRRPAELNWPMKPADQQSAFMCCRLFRQPMVPMVAAEDGHWLMAGALQPMLKPGGHGAIWKLMHDQGVFDWLSQHTCEAAIVRQIRCATMCCAHAKEAACAAQAHWWLSARCQQGCFSLSAERASGFCG